MQAGTPLKTLREDQAHALVRGRPGALLITCEHASSALPPPLVASAEDRPWLQTHWGWDIGAELVGRCILQRLGGAGVFARFTRLVCDANRSPDDPTLIRAEVEGHPLSFNQGVSAAERRRRVETCHEPYHAAVSRQARALRPGRDLLLSIHSFTPEYLGSTREMELGVLYDDYEPLALSMHRRLSRSYRVALNAPYSGRAGLIYSAHRHGLGAGLAYLELEIRQDLLARPEQAVATGARIAGLLEGWRWEGARP